MPGSLTRGLGGVNGEPWQVLAWPVLPSDQQGWPRTGHMETAVAWLWPDLGLATCSSRSQGGCWGICGVGWGSAVQREVVIAQSPEGGFPGPSVHPPPFCPETLWAASKCGYFLRSRPGFLGQRAAGDGCCLSPSVATPLPPMAVRSQLSRAGPHACTARSGPLFPLSLCWLAAQGKKWRVQAGTRQVPSGQLGGQLGLSVGSSPGHEHRRPSPYGQGRGSEGFTRLSVQAPEGALRGGFLPRAAKSWPGFQPGGAGVRSRG